MRVLILVAGLLMAFPALADSLPLTPTRIVEWKPVYGRVEAHYTVPARTRIGGIVATLEVTEGDHVTAGQAIGTVSDAKLAFRIAALDAQLRAFASQLETAESELARGQTLLDKGVVTAQRLDQLRTQVDVVRNQVSATQAERRLVEQQGVEGRVLAPLDGRVLNLPTTVGAVLMAGEPLAMIGGGGFFLRLSIPERHAHALRENTPIRITAAGAPAEGRLVKIYPQIQNGRVVADVDVAGLDTAFVDARILVEVPVGEREALLVPAAAISSRAGLDFVITETGAGRAERIVVPGETVTLDTGIFVEILSGLSAGDRVIVP